MLLILNLLRLGPLAVEQKQIKKARSTRITKNKEDLVIPAQVSWKKSARRLLSNTNISLKKAIFRNKKTKPQRMSMIYTRY